MKIIAVIPARYASTRFHAKLMQDLGGKRLFPERMKRRLIPIYLMMYLL